MTLTCSMILTKACRDEVPGLFRCISLLGIEHMDIRPSNIVKALGPEYGFPNLPCPVGKKAKGKTFSWRLIDFELARKTDGITKAIMRSHNRRMEMYLYIPKERPLTGPCGTVKCGWLMSVSERHKDYFQT